MPDCSLPTSEPTTTTRRTVLRAAGLAALTGGGVGCPRCLHGRGRDRHPDQLGPGDVRAGPSASAPATSSAPAESPHPASASASKSAAPSGPSAATVEVPVGGGVILDDANYVITQPTAGEFKAFSKICTHQNCPVTAVEGGTINCSCHGSKFSIKDGSVQNGPATKPLPEAKVTVAGKQVVVTA